MADLLVTSPANPRVKAVLALRRRRERDATGLTLVEGYEELSLALDAAAVPRTLLTCPELYSAAGRAGSQDIGHQERLVAAARDAGTQVLRLGRAAFERVAYREGPDGLLGVLPLPRRSLQDLDPPDDALVLVAQAVEKPGNLGALLRTADAAGAHAVIAADPVTDWGNPNVVRASKGTVFALPVATATGRDTVAWCRRHGLRIVVTTPVAARRHTEADLTAAVALVVGSEKHGVDEALSTAADTQIGIAMCGKVNSLNVSVAAAVVLYEARRQRASKRLHD